MSDQIPTGAMPGGQQQPSEEELRAAIGQMRASPVDSIIAEVLSVLLNAAQVKLGRNDGRMLLDLTDVVAEGTRGQVDEQLTKQIDDALGQLRMAQVQAEQEIVQAATEGHVEQNDLPRRPAPLKLADRPAPAEAATGEGRGDGGQDAEGSSDDVSRQRPQQQPAPGSSASRLWVPGR